MIPGNCRIKAILIIAAVAMATSFCAPKNFLVVNYQLPAEPEVPTKPSVSLVIKDSREDPAIVTRTAKTVLKDFHGNFALIVDRENENSRLVGAFSLHSLIRELFKHRLENAGVRVAAEEESREIVVEIILKAFKLDFVERKWVINMTYQANLLKQDRFVSGETITGSAERLRIAGSKEAEKVVGELITDVVNRLNLNTLFESD
jgi:uncharacterized lipoprotein YajG